MKPVKETVIPIEPQTHVRSTKGDKWLFAVSDEYLQEYDQKRYEEALLTNPKAKPGRNLNRKRQLEKYNAYKEELHYLAVKHNFEMPHGFFALWFYVPHPKSWRKKKIAEKLYKPHQSTPDWDNYIKAMFDALMPRKRRTNGETGADDRLIHCGAIFKVWVLPEEACIKVVEYPEFDFMEAFRHGHPSHNKNAPV